MLVYVLFAGMWLGVVRVCSGVVWECVYGMGIW